MPPGKRLRIARAKGGLTQTELARAAGLTQQAVARLESGETPLTPALARRLSRVLSPDVPLLKGLP